MRPDLFSLLFFVIYIFILSLHIDKRWAIYAIVAVQILWSNMHGFFFFGPLFVLIAILAEWIKRTIKLPWEWNKVGRLTDEEYNRLGIIFFLTLLASFINPMTFQGAWYPISVFLQLSGESRVFFDYIQELQRPITRASLGDIQNLPYFKAIIILSAYSFIFNRRKIDIGVFIFWLIFLGFSLVALRNIVYFGVAAYLVTVTNAMTISFHEISPVRFTYKKFQYISSAILKLALAFWMLNFGLFRINSSYFDYDMMQMKSETDGISLRNYPTKAVDFLVDMKVQGNILNEFNSGAYLVGRCYPDIKVFIDGRTEVYGAKFFELYRRIWQKNDISLMDKMIQDNNITIALLSSISHAISPQLLQYFYQSKEWKLVYFDYDGVVFLKKTPPHQWLIDKFKIDLAKWEEKKINLSQLGARRVSAYQYANRAFTLEALGADAAAEAHALEALKIDPTTVDAYKILGKIYAKRREFQKTFENFRLAAMYDPGSKESRFNLAQSYFDLKNYPEAIKQYEAIIIHDSKDTRAHFLLARAFLKDGQYDKALDIGQKAHQLSPSAYGDVFELGNMFFEVKNYKAAKVMYELALKIKSDSVELHDRMAKVHLALEEWGSARQEWKAALELDPKNKGILRSLKKLNQKKLPKNVL